MERLFVEEQWISVEELEPPKGGLETQEAWDTATRIYRDGRDLIGAMFKIMDYHEYVELLIGAVGDLHRIPPRVRTYLERMARRDWLEMERDLDHGEKLIDLIHHVDIKKARGAQDWWYTLEHYVTSNRRITKRDYPAPDKVRDSLDALRASGWTVRSYGATWHRAWPGKPAPVRDRDGIARARQLLADGTFYVPEDYNIGHSQIDFAYDL